MRFALVSLHRGISVFAVLTSAAALVSCSPDGGSGSGGRCNTTLDCGPGLRCIDNRCAAPPDGDTTTPDGGTIPPGRTIVSIAIEPATAELVAVDGAMPTQMFAVVATYDDGTTGAAIGPSFAIDTVSLGDLDPASGLFAANGVIGGAATITATVTTPAGDLTATASLTVRLERTYRPDGVPMDIADRFTTLVDDGARSAQLVYPLDGAVMPQNVYPADVQWLNGTAGDFYRVTLMKPHVRVVAYLAHDGMNHWLVDGAAWRGIAQTDADDPAQIAVDRFEAASSTAIRGAAVSVRFARAALTGSVYYWDIARGRIVRIDDGTASAIELMPSPPAGIDGERCIGCHTVSNSGRYMAGRLGGGENIGAVFDLTTDLTGDPPPTMWPIGGSSLHWWFSSWSPDDTRLVVSTDEGSSRTLAIYDPLGGLSVGVSGAMPTNATHPAWAPDGSAIAYVANVDTWGGANTRGDIALLPVTGADAFGPAAVIHRGADLAASPPGGLSDAYPTWTPDAQRIAFAHGDGSRSEDRRSALYIMARDGSGVVRLDRACGGAASETDFQPRFSPFDQGGYFWLSFLSRRDYGNSQVGTRGTGYQQIWVTAIRKDAPAGSDPSEVAYWLPGQRTTSRNISAYWAPRPCRPDGESCSVGSECCGGDCRPDATGALVCSPPPPERCRREMETCTTTADCCEGLECFGRVCIAPPG